MAASSHTGPWTIALEATQARLTVHGRRGLRLLHAPPVEGSFYLRPDGALAGFALRLPLRHGVLRWESADVDRDGRAWLRLRDREVRAPVTVVCAEIPGPRPYVKIVLDTVFRSAALGLRGALWPRPVRLRVFSEIRSHRPGP
jgi:hypothetical protein